VTSPSAPSRPVTDRTRADHGGRSLTAAAIGVAVIVLLLNAAVLYGALDRIDPGIFIVQTLITLLLLAAALFHIRRLVVDRRRYALGTLLGVLFADPTGIEPTAQAALALLIANDVAESGLVALADDDVEEMRPVASQGYPSLWLEEAQPRALPARTAGIDRGRDQSTHPWVAPVTTRVGEHPWVARIPLRSAGNPIGMVLLLARQPGALDDEALLKRIGAQFATAVNHAAMYEASYQREQALEDLDQRRREFIDAMAHEVRTPLTSIQAFADLLQLQPMAMDETAELLVNSLNQSIQRLNLLVNDLLDLGQSEATGFAVDATEVELAPLFAEVETLLRPAYLLSEQALTFEIGEGGAAVHADRDRLVQVLLNLLSNANRYTPAGGTVALRTMSGADGVRIEVDDSGEGIPEEHREQMFDPNYRVDRNDATVHGSGLGLAVARQLIELQSGRLWVEDALDGGARFCIELPRPNGTNAVASAAGAPGSDATVG
jgi:signal transduction histidine kinase